MLIEDNKDKFWEIAETEWKGAAGFKAVAIIPLEAVRNFRIPKQPRVISPRLVLRRKELDSRQIAKNKMVRAWVQGPRHHRP